MVLEPTSSEYFINTMICAPTPILRNQPPELSIFQHHWARGNQAQVLSLIHSFIHLIHLIPHHQPQRPLPHLPLPEHLSNPLPFFLLPCTCRTNPPPQLLFRDKNYRTACSGCGRAWRKS